jgi:NitT/TauT family transport system substrate-binding protein
LFTSNALIKKNKDLVARFTEATRKGWAAYLKDAALTNKKITELNPAMNAETINTVLKAQKPLMMTAKGKPLGTMDESRWELLSKQMKDIELIKKPVPAKDLFQQF